MIQLQNINFSYSKDRMLFNNLNLSLEGGHVYGLFGKNGAGKTTLLKIMSGLRFIQSGNVTTLGENAALRKAEMMKDIYFLQEEVFVPALSIRNFVKCYAPFYENFDKMELFDSKSNELKGYLKRYEIDPDYVCFAASRNQRF